MEVGEDEGGGTSVSWGGETVGCGMGRRVVVASDSWPGRG